MGGASGGWMTAGRPLVGSETVPPPTRVSHVLTDTHALKLLFNIGLALLPYLYLPVTIFPSENQPVYLLFWVAFILLFHLRTLLAFRLKRFPFYRGTVVASLYVFLLIIASIELYDISFSSVLRRAGGSMLVPLLVVHAVSISRYLGYDGVGLCKRISLYFIPIYAMGSLEVVQLLLKSDVLDGALLGVRQVFVGRGEILDRLSLFASEPSYAVLQITFLLFVSCLLNQRLWLTLQNAVLIVFFFFTLSLTGLVIAIPLALVRTSRRGGAVITGIGILVVLQFALELLAVSDLDWTRRITAQSFFEPSALQYRYVFALSSLFAFLKAPIFGIGLGRYEDIWLSVLEERGYVPGSREMLTVGFDRPHQHINPWLGVLADTGIVGGLLFTAFVVLLLKNLDVDRRLKLALIAYTAIVLAVAPPLSSPYLWVLLGVANLGGFATRTRNPERASAPE